MSEREAKKQKTEKDGDENLDISRQDLIFRLSMKGMSIDAIAEVGNMEPGEVVRILEQAESTVSKDSAIGETWNQGLGLLVKRLMTDPPELCCHISHALMEDPVVAQDGQTYERDCIEGCLKTGTKSPMSGAVMDTWVLYPNQKMKSDIVSFKENIVKEILNVAPQLPDRLALKVLSRAEEFLRAQLPDKSAQRKLSTLLLLKVKLPDVKRNDTNQEIVSLLVESEDDAQLQQFLCKTEEFEVVSLLSNLDKKMVDILHTAMQTSSASCKFLIDKNLACRLAICWHEVESRKQLWRLLLMNCMYETNSANDWAQAAAVVLVTFIETLDVSLQEVSTQLLLLAGLCFDDQNGASVFAKKFFECDFDISTCLQWPPKGSGKILAELGIRPVEETEHDKFQLLVRAHAIDGRDVQIRRSLIDHCKHLEAIDSTPVVESLLLKLMLEDNEKIETNVLMKLSLQENRIKDLSAEHLMSLAQQLVAVDRREDAAIAAVDAAKLFVQKGQEEDSHHAFLKAFGWDRENPYVSEGLVTALMALKQRCQSLEKSIAELKDCQILEGKCHGEIPSGTSFVWDLSGYDFTRYSRGQREWSEAFQIHPGIKAWILIYPKGRQDSIPFPGIAAAFLYLENGAKVHFSLEWGSIRAAEHNFTPSSEYGWTEFVIQQNCQNITLKVWQVQPKTSLRMVFPGSS